MKKSIIAKIVSIIFIIILVLGTLSLVFLPRLYDLFKEPGINNFGSQTLLYQITFYLCFIICLIIVYKLTTIFNQIYKDSPFIKKVENSLKVTTVLFMILAIIIMIKAIFIPTLLSVAISLICFVASLSFYVLAEVIKSAIEYKDELDYTV